MTNGSVRCTAWISGMGDCSHLGPHGVEQIKVSCAAQKSTSFRMCEFAFSFLDSGWRWVAGTVLGEPVLRRHHCT